MIRRTLSPRAGATGSFDMMSLRGVPAHGSRLRRLVWHVRRPCNTLHDRIWNHPGEGLHAMRPFRTAPPVVLALLLAAPTAPAAGVVGYYRQPALFKDGIVFVA